MTKCGLGVQSVLSDLAKRGKDTILYEGLVYEVRGQFLGTNTRYGQYYKRFIMGAVAREIRARRIRLDTSPELHVISMTPSGLRFYKEWGAVPLYTIDHPRLKYLSIRQIQKYSAVLRDILSDIQDSFREFRPLAQDIEGLDALPGAVEDLCTTVQNLELQNSDLQLDLNYENRAKRALMNENRAS
ncbi:hypothetical protein GY45DRAFT_1376196 [Cubamyces sp. BRFM 1775]|nr:hypothetical protein GY45DRAFT_1376196 [Cubamyces sp. BRFM 1775]